MKRPDPSPEEKEIERLRAQVKCLTEVLTEVLVTYCTIDQMAMMLERVMALQKEQRPDD